MLNVVYLVLIMSGGSSGLYSGSSVSIPQANIAQCKANQKNYAQSGRIVESHCIVGVMPK